MAYPGSGRLHDKQLYYGITKQTVQQERIRAQR